MAPIINDFANRKGTLTLRSDHMNYGRAVLNCKWNLAREAEPKDYNFSKHPLRNLALSTYRRLAAGNEPTPETTYTEHYNQIFDKDDYTERQASHPIIDQESAMRMRLDRETGHSNTGHGVLLPRHSQDRRMFRKITTYNNDFQLPFPYRQPKFQEDAHDSPFAYRRCNSQFTDRADYRRPGRNTFWDESGLYANSLLRTQSKPYWWRHPASGNPPQMWILKRGETFPGSSETCQPT